MLPLLVLLQASHMTAFNWGGLAWLEGPAQAFCWFGGCSWPAAGPWSFSLCGHSSSIRLDWFPGGDSRKQEGISGPRKALAQTSSALVSRILLGKPRIMHTQIQRMGKNGGVSIRYRLDDRRFQHSWFQRHGGSKG